MPPSYIKQSHAQHTCENIIVYNNKLIKVYKIIHVVISLGAIVFVIRSLLLFANVTLKKHSHKKAHNHIPVTEFAQ